jgi:hypothetical protein
MAVLIGKDAIAAAGCNRGRRGTGQVQTHFVGVEDRQPRFAGAALPDWLDRRRI